MAKDLLSDQPVFRLALDAWMEVARNAGKTLSGPPSWLLFRLYEQYTKPNRYYHNWSHIADCLAQANRLRALFREPEVAIIALLYHDVVYDATRQDNEEQSTAILGRDWKQLGIRSGLVLTRIERAIMATKHDLTWDYPDTQLVCDIDLSGLATAWWPRFLRNSLLIRREYAHVTDEAEFWRARSEFLNRFAHRGQIYQSPAFAHLEGIAQQHVALFSNLVNRRYPPP